MFMLMVLMFKIYGGNLYDYDRTKHKCPISRDGNFRRWNARAADLI